MRDNRKLEFWVSTTFKREDLEDKIVLFDVISCGRRWQGKGWFVYRTRLEEDAKVYIQLRFQTAALPGEESGTHTEIHGLPQEAVDCIRVSEFSLYDLEFIYPHELRPQ